MRVLLSVLLFSGLQLELSGQSTFCAYSSESWFERSKRQISGHEEKGFYKENLSIFQEGHRRGYFYFLHPALPRLEPYLEFAEFEQLAETDRHLLDSANAVSRTLYRVELPVDFNRARNYPLFMIFHGGNSNFQRVLMHWNTACLDRNFIKVYIQSYRHFDAGTFTWRSGDPRSDEDIRRIYLELRDQYPVDTSHTVLAGISAGASYALGMALRGIIPVQGLLAFCPGLPQVFRSDSIPELPDTNFRVYILGGEHDFYRQQQEMLMTHLDRSGIPHVYEQVKDMGHQYPDDEGNYILKGLQFLGTK